MASVDYGPTFESFIISTSSLQTYASNQIAVSDLAMHTQGKLHFSIFVLGKHRQREKIQVHYDSFGYGIIRKEKP